MIQKSPPFGTLVEDDLEEERRLAREKAAEEAQQEANWKIAQERLAVLRKFKIDREGRPPIVFVVNLRTGQVAGQEEVEGRHVPWSRVRALHASKWLRRRSIELEPLWDFSLYHLPDWLYQPSDESRRDVRKLIRQARRTAYGLEKARSIKASVAELGENIGCLLHSIGSAIVSAAIGVGILGLLVFGWKQVF